MKTVFLLLFLPALHFAQNPPHTYNTIWFRLFFTGNITEKINYDLMLQHRREAAKQPLNFIEKEQLVSAWLWLHYSLSKSIKLSISPIGYFETRRLFALDLRPIKEWRCGIRADHVALFGKLQMLNRASLEYRYRDIFIANEFKGNMRARYQLRFTLPIASFDGRKLSVITFDEVFLQFGGALKAYPQLLDQNRIYAGLSQQVLKNTKFELAYCYVVQKRHLTSDTDLQNAIWVALTIDNLFSHHKKQTPS